uniref:ribulose-phosphate 3-epimerase n=1 Tax=Capra hircus TaxID=9925 RepID=A0A452E0N3_CAPHI
MHMMVSRPEQWVKPMAVAGANQYTFHLEATDNPGALIKDIRENGMKVRAYYWCDVTNLFLLQVGLAIKPGTSVEYLAPWKFMDDMMPKDQFPSLDIEVDGGVGPDTIHKCAEVRLLLDDVFLELSCFFHDPADVGNLISGSSAFSKTSLNIRNHGSRIAEAWLGEF